ncbi:MAG: hypothetical protein K6G16_06975 [Lachnospiraceae bacterium]|nr:hypothetical protein [Lachnospiraceae bacterium]
MSEDKKMIDEEELEEVTGGRSDRELDRKFGQKVANKVPGSLVQASVDVQGVKRAAPAAQGKATEKTQVISRF